ncbi:MAG TPA: menaquinone biosynthesis protein [Blastocatellia bacterium]|nr:menaquinone biosynthesis protein [Blastocatellia bacterium]
MWTAMRIAASTYLNSAPLVYGFASGSQRHRVRFLGDTAPSRCAQMLAAAQCDVALIPVIESQRIPNLRLIPGTAVASKQRVRSVVLAARVPPEEARTVTLDTSSRTSQALVKILFAERWHSGPQFIERTPDVNFDCENMLEASDGALVIGDPTFRLHERAEMLGVRIYDLAEEWRAMTGLPFVFAVWAARQEVCEDGRITGVDFIAAKNEGLLHLEEIAQEYACSLNLPLSLTLSYLRDNVNFELDEENLAGMRRYFALAHKHGLIETLREPEFVGSESVGVSWSQ